MRVTHPSSPSKMNIRRHPQGRVSRACDSCRVSKAKCDGNRPCSRCKAKDHICVFAVRRPPPKNHPEGYVEILEQQQSWLVCGLRQLYKLSIQGKSWPGERLKEDDNGYPLTHDVLSRLGALDKPPEAEEPPQENIGLDPWLQGFSHVISPSLCRVDTRMPSSPPRMTGIPFQTISSPESLQPGEPGLKQNSIIPYFFPPSQLSLCDGKDPNIAGHDSMCLMDEPLFSDEIDLAEGKSRSSGYESLSSSFTSNFVSVDISSHSLGV
ncbi:hypothetical protein ASPCAL05067 [Aspergillus calidoustus]|uniref:Zn(2)-C6 fungal-type domain-containing protein n=1 Tax=Aspergillus calidoustus TaxID=454130 RepID=A0A0U5C6E8_ASPCI|nr:hypothetical protein ASPCAL05067 [Aspergillus calidoustus]